MGNSLEFPEGGLFSLFFNNSERSRPGLPPAFENSNKIAVANPSFEDTWNEG